MTNEFICDLCPRRCHAIRDDEKGTGFCRAPLVPQVNLISKHFGEEPVVSGTQGSGTVFFEGCSLGCIFCQNHSISHGLSGNGIPMKAERLAEEYMNLQDLGVHNINLVTFMHYAPEVARSIELAKGLGLKVPVVANISGYEEVSTLRMFRGLIDIYLTDMKFYSPEVSQRLARTRDYFVKCCLATDEMYSQTGAPSIGSDGMMKKGVIVRHLMIPGYLFDTKHILDYLTSRYGNNIYISLMNQYTPPKDLADPLPQDLDRTLAPSHYQKMVDLLTERGQENAFIQGSDASGNEFLPGFIL